MVFEDDGVYIEQYPSNMEQAVIDSMDQLGLEEVEIEEIPDVVFLTHEMFRNILLATNLPEGTFRTDEHYIFVNKRVYRLFTKG